MDKIKSGLLDEYMTDLLSEKSLKGYFS